MTLSSAEFVPTSIAAVPRSFPRPFTWSDLMAVISGTS